MRTTWKTYSYRERRADVQATRYVVMPTCPLWFVVMSTCPLWFEVNMIRVCDATTLTYLSTSPRHTHTHTHTFHSCIHRWNRTTTTMWVAISIVRCLYFNFVCARARMCVCVCVCVCVPSVHTILKTHIYLDSIRGGNSVTRQLDQSFVVLVYICVTKHTWCPYSSVHVGNINSCPNIFCCCSSHLCVLMLFNIFMNS